MSCNGCGFPIKGEPINDWLGTYCSSQCSELYHKRRNLKQPVDKQCDCCATHFQTPRSKQRFCSYECRAKHSSFENNEKFKAKMREVYPDGIKRKPCGWCGETLEVPAKKTLASRKYHETCSLEAQRARYRIKTVKRQSKTKPSRLAADQVLREYGDKCHICNEPIDLELARTSRMGLTVDHVIPLSKGGTDEIHNLRPAHWICNNRKSDKLYA